MDITLVKVFGEEWERFDDMYRSKLNYLVEGDVKSFLLEIEIPKAPKVPLLDNEKIKVSINLLL
jgi:hypothetical protein